MKALLTETAMRRLEPAAFRFCGANGCDTVYFDDAGRQRFTVAEIRVAVWHKEPMGARGVCYCFGENEADMVREIQLHGATRAAQRVKDHIAARRCACDVRNPRGVCCLGDVIAAVKRMQAATVEAPV